MLWLKNREAGITDHHNHAATEFKGWQVTLAGMGINLALGVVYAWSVISHRIPDAWGWSEAGRSWPYAICILVLSLCTVPGGWLQDRFGPRLAATLGGLLLGAGFLIASLTNSLYGYMIGYGVVAGAGMGFGYAATLPAAVKWFPARRTGLIAGIVVSGFGFASVYVAPLAEGLIHRLGVSSTMRILGVAFMAVVIALAQLLRTPPGNFHHVSARAAKGVKSDFTPVEMLRTWQFYLLWFLFICGAGAGLMIISKMAKIVYVQANLTLGFLLVAMLALGNGLGRIGAGWISDHLGRKRTLFVCFVLQTIFILLLSQAHQGTWLAELPVLIMLAMMIGALYGANLSLFPSLTKAYFGLRHFGVNYGLVSTAWGLGGFLLSLLAGWIYDITQSFAFAYYGSAVLLILAAIAVLWLKTPHHASDGD